MLENETGRIWNYGKDMSIMVGFYRDVLGFEVKEDKNASNVFLEKDGTFKEG